MADPTRNNCDRISSLTDPILCHILSFLPTKDSVHTTVLSTRWNRFFTQVPVLNFDYFPQQGNKADSFIRFVNRALLQYDLPYMHKFNLVCSQECCDDVPLWISAAIARNVCGMFVRFKARPENPQYRCIRLPRNLHVSKTLVELTLNGNFVFNLNDSNTCLPNLKKLHLSGVSIWTNESKQFHSSTFPMLEYLHLERCHMRLTVNISISSLKGLELYQNAMICFVLNLPALEFLEFSSREGMNHMSGSVLESLKEARISSCTRFPTTDKTLKLIKTTHNLYLHGNSMHALRGSELPNFQNLTRLKLGSASENGWKLLPDLLESSPNLEILILDIKSLRYGEGHVDMDHVLPKHECTCLSMHLKELKIKRFSGADYEFKLVEYFLNNAKVLEKLMIHTNKPLESQYMTRVIRLTHSRHSKDCRVLVINKQG